MVKNVCNDNDHGMPGTQKNWGKKILLMVLCYSIFKYLKIKNYKNFFVILFIKIMIFVF
jgi:hypothetical protein